MRLCDIGIYESAIEELVQRHVLTEKQSLNQDALGQKITDILAYLLGSKEILSLIQMAFETSDQK